MVACLCPEVFEQKNEVEPLKNQFELGVPLKGIYNSFIYGEMGGGGSRGVIPQFTTVEAIGIKNINNNNH